MSRYLMTQSLLSDWQYIFDANDGEDAFDAFRRNLRKEPRETSDAAIRGIAFENDVAAICADPYYESDFITAAQTAQLVQGGQFQVKESKKVRFAGMDFLLYGKLDVLRAGSIFDIKYTGHYDVGKYYNSPQHPMYFALVPEAREFVYVVTDGKDVFTERYFPGDAEPIEYRIRSFLSFLESFGLMDDYRKHWECRYG